MQTARLFLLTLFAWSPNLPWGAREAADFKVQAVFQS